MEDEYLGDGVYASFDGYHVWFDLRQQSELRIGLEPEVLHNLTEYAHRCYRHENERAAVSDERNHPND